MKFITYVACSLLLTSCGSGNNDEPKPPHTEPCSEVEYEATMNNLLSQASSEVDFSFILRRSDGREFIFNRGDSNVNTIYESASSSKIVSAVLILRLVELGYIALDDKPQDHITNWPIESNDPLYNINLKHLLSFTSGLETEALCINLGAFDFQTCVDNIASRNSGNGITPGQTFYYSSSHLQVAGLMAYQAFGANSWQAIFSDFQTQTGLFLNSSFDLPSSSNPRLAGGMKWSGADYIDFLFALMNNDILNATSMALLLNNYTAGVTMTYSPAFDTLSEDWGYGFGLWHECESVVFNCALGNRISSPGAYGAYPYWDQNAGYVGIVARQGQLGTFENGIAIEKTVRATAELWAACK